MRSLVDLRVPSVIKRSGALRLRPERRIIPGSLLLAAFQNAFCFFLSAAGLSASVSAFHAVDALSKSMVIVNVNVCVLELLLIVTYLISIFEV